MSFYAISGLLNLVTSSVVGIFVFTRNVNDRRYQTYGGFCVSLAVWSFGYLFWHLSDTPEEALFWVKILMAGAIFIPITNFHHIVFLLDEPPWEKRWILLGYCFSFGFLYLDLFSPLFIKGVSPKSEFSFWPVPGPAFHVYLLLFFYCVLRFIFLLYRQVQTNTGIKRNQFKYLVFALSLGYIGGGTNFLLWYDIPVRPFGNILVSVYVVLFSYAVIKFSLLDIDFIIRKSLVYALLLLVLIVPCFALVITAQVMTFGEISYNFSLFTLLIFIVVGFLFPKLRIQAEDALERVLFKKSYDYRETLLRSSRDMISLIDVDSLSERLVHTISAAMMVQKASLCIVDEATGEFRIRASTGSRVESFGNIALTRDDPLVRRFRRSPSSVVREEIEIKKNHATGDRDIVNRMIELEAEISFPIMSKDKLIGILNLGVKQYNEIYSHEDIELLSTLANQAAVAIENARLYQNLK